MVSVSFLMRLCTSIIRAVSLFDCQYIRRAVWYWEYIGGKVSHRIVKFPQSVREILFATHLHCPDKIEENKPARQQSIGRLPVSQSHCGVPVQL